MLFIYSLFNDTVSISDYMSLSDCVIMDDALERIWKEADVKRSVFWTLSIIVIFI
jgi:hypothetical protein